MERVSWAWNPGILTQSNSVSLSTIGARIIRQGSMSKKGNTRLLCFAHNDLLSFALNHKWQIYSILGEPNPRSTCNFQAYEINQLKRKLTSESVCLNFLKKAKATEFQKSLH